jgi:hypothetical protein
MMMQGLELQRAHDSMHPENPSLMAACKPLAAPAAAVSHPFTVGVKQGVVLGYEPECCGMRVTMPPAVSEAKLQALVVYSGAGFGIRDVRPTPGVNDHAVSKRLPALPRGACTYCETCLAPT